MEKYMLFREWNSETLYGETLEDALKRAGELHRPDGRPVKIENNTGVHFERNPGETVTIAYVIGIIDSTNLRRGDIPVTQVMVEDTAGKIHVVDVKTEPIELIARDQTVRLRVTDAEKDTIQKAASEAGQTLSQYIRDRIL